VAPKVVVPVAGARQLVQVLVEKWPADEWIRHMAHVLEPPVARAVPSLYCSFDKERAWLKAHAYEYPGCWIAVMGDRILAADPSRRRVEEILDSIPESDRAVLYYKWPNRA
jgi:hypothetical protein